MPGDLTTFFTSRLTPGDRHHGERDTFEMRFAAAALLLVCAKSDFRDHPDEERAIVDLLGKTFEIERSLIEELVALLDTDAAVRGIHQLTELVNKHYTVDDKRVLMENLWIVAYADGQLDRFEEQFINRVAFMIRMSDQEVAACREAARGG